MTKIQVPEGMLQAAMESRKELTGQAYGWSEGMCSQVVEAALQWLMEDELYRMLHERLKMMVAPSAAYVVPITKLKKIANSLFLAEPEIPEEVKDLLSPTCQNLWEPSKKEYDAAVLEAFRRGRSKGSVSLPEPEKGSIFYRERSKG